MVVGWAWAGDDQYNEWGRGWLKNLGYIDFAGSGVVHAVGGVCALWGAKILGPRYGYEKNKRAEKMKA